MARYIDADAFASRMYHEAFEKDSDMQKWDSGCWIRYRLFEEVLRGQPTITPEPHWIPCSERLPEVKQKVLVQYADESMATKRCNDAGHLAWFYSNAVAWMPAPESYKGVTDGRD